MVTLIGGPVSSVVRPFKQHASETSQFKFRGYACRAVRDFDSFEASLQFLNSSGLHDQPVELAKLNQDALGDAITSNRPSLAILNRPELIHFALVFNDFECASSLSSSTTDPNTLKFFPLSGIWKPYSFALARFVTGKPMDVPALPNCKGYEKFFMPYIAYMDNPTDENVTAMTSSFVTRNQDRRYTDWVGLDGDGSKPVRWDLRAWTLTQGRIR